MIARLMRSSDTAESAIVGGRYSLQRPAFDAVLERIEVLRGIRQTLPAGCVELTSRTDLVTRTRP
jgi:hypothetical protein